MARTIAEKILSQNVGRAVSAGEVVFPEPDLATVHDWYIVNFARALDDLGVTRLHDPERVMFVTDHEPLAVSGLAAERQKAVRAIAARYGVRHFFDSGRGGQGHVFPVEMGFVRPGMYISGYDTHVTNFGAVGALAIAVLTEVAELLALGSVWQIVPETVRVRLTGSLPPGVSVRDAAQALIGRLDPDLIDDAVVEFTGPGLASIDVDGRMTLCNTPTELGARSSVVETDALVQRYLAARVAGPVGAIASDPDARFRDVVEVDLSRAEPVVAAPPRPDNVVPVGAVAGRPIDHAYVGSCAGGMLADIRAAAAILRGRQVHPRVRLFVTPATQEVQRLAMQEGLLEALASAGAMITPPGCGVCAGGRIGPVADGEVSIGTGTRNDPGRLVSHGADLYLAGAATVAASALAGQIADPRAVAATERREPAAHGA